MANATGPDTVRATSVTPTPAMVVPTTGMTSSSATSRASSNGNGTWKINSEIRASPQAINEIVTLPST